MTLQLLHAAFPRVPLTVSPPPQMLLLMLLKAAALVSLPPLSLMLLLMLLEQLSPSTQADSMRQHC
jgi:hypothetical protein